MINKKNILQGSAANFIRPNQWNKCNKWNKWNKVGLLCSARQKNNNVDLAFFDSLQASGAKAQLNILKKKINVNKVKTIPLKRHERLGYLRHYPASNADWSSSIYQHENNNYLKSLPLLDKNILKLIKSYFNFFHPSEKLWDFNDKWVDSKKSTRIRFLRTSLRNIFIGKANFKHTNSKVIITIHLFNLQIKYWFKKWYSLIKKYKRHNNVYIKTYIWTKSVSPIKYQFNKKFKILKFYKKICKIWRNKKSTLFYKEIKNLYDKDIKPFLHEINFGKKDEKGGWSNIKKQIENLLYKKYKFITYKEIKNLGGEIKKILKQKLRIFNKEVPLRGLYIRRRVVSLNYDKADYKLNIALMLRDWFCYKLLPLKLWLEKLVHFYSYIKFKKYLPKLIKLISKIYKKKVEINIVILKYMYLNSDILSQAVALKLRDRDNRVWRVLRSCLSMVHIPYRNKFRLPLPSRSEGTEVGLTNKVRSCWSSTAGLTNKVRLRREKSLAKIGLSLLEKIKNLELRRSAESFISQLNKTFAISKTSIFASKEISCFAYGVRDLARHADLGKRGNKLNVLLPPSVLAKKRKGLLCFVPKEVIASRPYSIAKGKILYFPFIKKTILLSKAFALHRNNNDILNHLIFGVFPLAAGLGNGGCQFHKAGYTGEGKFKNWAFYFKNSLKYKVLRGVRLEAKGRLTRRFTASRSIFKLKWKGGLKNLDSSYRGLSASILRGHVKANVQYTLVSSKNRIGAYGIKGWVGGK